MRNNILYIICFFLIGDLMSQEIDSDLVLIKKRMDSIVGFTAELQLDIDVDFIKMPTKYADLEFKKGKPMQFSSDDFILIPKRGFDFTLSEIFKNEFITVDRGSEFRNDKILKKINIIPTNRKTDYSIATIIIDMENMRIESTEISTKKNGFYLFNFSYNKEKVILPDNVIVKFEIDRIKIPLSFMGKTSEIDKKKLISEEKKAGKIFLKLRNYKVDYLKSFEPRF